MCGSKVSVWEHGSSTERVFGSMKAVWLECDVI